MKEKTALTRPSTKKQERFFVKEAARSLGKTWNLGGDREDPDFIVTEDAQQFGLEVTRVFMGPQNRKGSAMKTKESITQSAVGALRRKYEAISNIPLSVKFVGDMCADNLAKLFPRFLRKTFHQSRPVTRLIFIPAAGCTCMSQRLFVPIGSA
jgi:hypothetical protein